MKKWKSKVKWQSWTTKNREEEIYKKLRKSTPCGQKRNEEYIDIDKNKRSSLEEPIIMEELDRAIRKGRIEACPGKDGIEYTTLNLLPGSFKEKPLNIFNIFNKGKIADQWKEYIVFFIDKSGKEKVRPIAISSCLAKTLKGSLIID